MDKFCAELVQSAQVTYALMLHQVVSNISSSGAAGSAIFRPGHIDVFDQNALKEYCQEMYIESP
jgi:hypothetical protein